MIKLTVRLLVDRPGDEVLNETSLDSYSPEGLNALIAECIEQGEKEATRRKYVLGEMQPQVSILLSADDSESIRPALHINEDVIVRVARIRGSIDFDPYV